MLGCVIKEEIDIPFDQVDNVILQQIAYEKALADSTNIETNILTNIKIKECPLNIKKEIDDDMIIEQWMYGMKEKWSIQMEHQLINEDMIKKEEIDEDKVNVTSDVDSKKSTEVLKMKAGKIVLERLSINKILELIQKVRKNPNKIEKKTVKKGAKNSENIEKKIEEKRILRERKKKTPEEMDNKPADRRKLQARNPKRIVNAVQLKTKRKNCNKSRISRYIKQHCPNCKLTLEKELHVVRNCLKCRTPFVYECLKCKKQYQWKNSMKNHLDTKCLIRIMHYCQLCKYTTTKYTHMKRHVINMHGGKIEDLPTLIETTSVQK